ncbi:chromodomain-helicase-DNA-binding protein 1-like isoform X2 [Engraulis encrasicolus]|uniref:chromodomain-helicase-DNA-binding protein 1-like isoform X2 n=1 Tax=Engraulis encrasicolus TaxID=184585 RepID=UPI002FD377DD
MAAFVRRVTKIPDKDLSDLSGNDLTRWGLSGIQLRSYQLDGVRWLTQSLKHQEGCILGDEMGLGKTCQTIALLLYAKGALGKAGPFLVLSPLSVMDNWRQEMQRFSPGLAVVCYSGDKEKRAELQAELLADRRFHVLLTTYEMCLKDASFLKRWKWKILVVDEAHRLKNQNSLLHQTLCEFSVGFRVLLTGTPIQNNLQEVYSLLSFVQPSLFPPCDADDFVSTYADVQTCPDLAKELHGVLQPFLLRRVKAEVATELPKKTELVMFHGMSALQKKYYKAILMKDLDAFGVEQASRTRLLNILMQLRKCVDHPYLFDGVEPEPFEMGEHLVEASGKLLLLDSILAYLCTEGHRVLLFSQMTRMLDILQDYLEYRGYSYERLDGSVRGEERNLAIKNFSTKDVFVFLLSTKAGGVGMNLTAADTVIFVDSDFNPQNDLQAAARAHRIGQTRAVKVVRLVARDTVEEIVYRRAISKLQLTDTVIEHGRFSLLDQAQSAAAGLQLSDILKFGVDKLLASDESSVQDVDLRLILGQSRDGHWLTEEDDLATAPPTTKDVEDGESGGADTDGQNHMYYFEGKDYSRDPSSEDQEAFDALMQEQLEQLQKAGEEGRALRCKTNASLAGPLRSPLRLKRPLTADELEQRRQRRQEAAAKRAKLAEERKRKQEEEKQRKKLAWWESCGYTSRCLPGLDSEGEDEENADEEDDDDGSGCSSDSEHMAIRYALGDVTHPHAAKEGAIILHCIDDSGRWGRGGLFTALEVRSDEPRKQYELAGKMKDLELGHVLFFPIDDKQSRLDGKDYLALIVAQTRDRSNNLSGILLSALEEGLRKISRVAKATRASVHLPRIGHATKAFNWYGTERLLRKHLVTRGIPTTVYYYRRGSSVSATSAASAGPSTSAHPPAGDQGSSSSPRGVSPSPPSSPSPPASPASWHSSSPEAKEQGQARGDGPEEASAAGHSSASFSLSDFMGGVHVFFYNMAASDRKRLARHLIAYDGDEEDIMSSHVTHIVAEVESPAHTQELCGLVQQYPGAQAVHKRWLEACFSRQAKVNTSPFLLQLQ